MYVRELLPDLGQIGAQVGFTAGLCANPYDAGRGVCGGGFVALPLARVAGGKLSYEIDMSLARSRGEPFSITNTLAYIANLAAGASPSAAAAGPPGAPHPVLREVRTSLRVLRVSPFGLRYSFSSAHVPRLRPYVAAGLDAVVVLSAQEPLGDEGTDLPRSAALDSVLIGGLLAQAPELDELGLPSGQGNVQLGAHVAAGVELRLLPRLSLNVEGGYVAIEGAAGGQKAARAALGFHW